MTFLLDTNVLSELRKGERCDPCVAAWFRGVPEDELFLSVLVIGELRYGAERIRARDPRQYAALDKWLILAVDRFANRTMAVDRQVAEQWGRLVARATIATIDGLIAATALAHGLIVVTRNLRDFARTGVQVLNPFEPLSQTPDADDQR